MCHHSSASVIILQQEHTIHLHVRLKTIFQLPIYATTLTPPRFTCSSESNGPSAMCGWPHKVCGSPARNESQQSQDYEPKVQLLPTTNHGTLWQVAKSISLYGMNALISGVLAPLNFLQKPKMRTSTSMLCP